MLNTSYSKLTVLAYNYIMWVKDLIPQKKQNDRLIFTPQLIIALHKQNSCQFLPPPPIVLHRIPNFKTY